ncbi:cation:proton antiporter [Pontiellaceae bacterium B1224]|nr:cation:proton antiporter [Pontiellaceae bacterium B1224]
MVPTNPLKILCLFSKVWNIAAMYLSMAILGGFIFVYSVVCGKLERTPVNGALVFLLFGLLVGPVGLSVLTLEVNADALSLLAEMTLALLLFTDAANADLKVLGENYKIPQRLLLIGLPLTIVLGFAFGSLLFGALSLFEVAVLAIILAPTDAALGKPVVTNLAVPGKMREGLNVESGLNDGICVPLLFIALALDIGVEDDMSTPYMALKEVMSGIGIGMAVGLGLTFAAYWILKACVARGWVSEVWSQLPVVALALLCFSMAQLLGGSGFIACFCGGLLFDRIERRHKKPLLVAAEGMGDTLALITWVLFGALAVEQSLHAFTWQIIFYSVLSLTVIRMLPVFLCLSGLGLSAGQKLFMGWFGPRGLASVVFAVIVLDAKVEHGHTIALTALCTILLSILLHGLSANPVVRRLFG